MTFDLLGSLVAASITLALVFGFLCLVAGRPQKLQRPAVSRPRVETGEHC